jgi:hypothetical protein
MVILRLAIPALALLSSALPSVAVGSNQPACVPSEVVPAHADSSSQEWLSRSAAGDIRAHVGKVAPGGSWKGNDLIVTCPIEGSALDQAAGLTVEDKGDGEAATRGLNFPRLAAATGHTREEGEELARKYEPLGGAFYRYVRDEKGREIHESDLILRQHEKKLGIVRPTEKDLGVDASSKQAKKAQADELREKIKAAKARGDMAEVMRLAGEAQAAQAPLAEKTMKVQERIDHQNWDLFQSAHADLARAAFRTRITFHPASCLRCRPPDLPRR